MTKWAILALLVGLGAGIGLWAVIDPGGRAAAAQMWSSARAQFAQAGTGFTGDSLWAPVASAFKDFADSVAGLWSGNALQIEVPSFQIQH